jgi:hypothetical protein
LPLATEQQVASHVSLILTSTEKICPRCTARCSAVMEKRGSPMFTWRGRGAKRHIAYAIYVNKVKSPDLVLGIGNIDKKTSFM